MYARGRVTARAAGFLAALAAVPVAAPAWAQTDADSATYTVTFQGNWTTASTPGGVVGSAHFTTLIGAVHNDMVTFWESGGMATAGVEGVAELGATSTFRSEINASAHADSVIRESVSFGGTGSATFDLTVTTDHPLVTLLSMIGPSPDWFVGISGRSLLDADDEWRSRLEVDLFPYDAGTEEGTEFSLSNAATSPQEAIGSIKGTGKFSNVRMARLTFVLQSPVVDEATVSVAGGSAAEGSPVEFTAALSESVGSDVVLGWTTGDDTAPDARQAAAGVDYTAEASGSVTVTAGETEATFQVATAQDTAPEGDETFAVTVTGSTLPAGVTIEMAGATGIIVDDDELAVTVAGGSAPEGSAVEFMVSLPQAVGSDVVLDWTTGDDVTPDARQATAGVDYTAETNGSVTILAGDMEATLQVATAPDMDPEGDETFTVTVEGATLPPGVVMPANMRVVGTIVDDDAVTVTVTGGSAPEGSPVEFTVGLSETVGSDVVLGWMTGNDATPNARPAMAGADYAETTDGQVTIPANATGATFEVLTLADDARVEGNETFAVTVTGGALSGGVAVPAGTRAIGTIRDEDRAMVTVSAGPPATEGDDLQFTVRLSERVFPEDVIVTWSTTDVTPNAGQATPGVDYAPELDRRLTIPANESGVTFTVATHADSEEEEPETFAVAVTAASLPEKTVVPPDTHAVGTIRDAGSGPGPGPGPRPAEVRLEAVAAEATEGGTVVFTVSLSRRVSSPVSLAWSIVDGTASAEDYAAVTAQTVTIAARETSASFEVRTIDDALVEEIETFTVAVAAAGSLSSRVRVPTDLRAVGTIMDNDESALAVTAADPAPEGEAVTFMVSLSAPVSSVVPLTWSTTGGTATAGDDYTMVAAQAVMIAAREMNAVFMAVEAAGALPFGVRVPADLRATALIEDDDSRASGFTDDPAVVGATAVRAVHLRELRERIDALRIARGLERFAHTDPAIIAGVTRVRAVHLTELRTALDEVYDAADRGRPGYTGEAREGAPLRAAHVNGLRRAIQALE